MSVDLYIVTPYEPEELRPSLIGLGEPPFHWPAAAEPTGFEYPGARLAFSARPLTPGDDDDVASRVSKLAPPEMKTIVSLHVKRGWEDVEHEVAAALRGSATSDAVLFSELWGEAVEGVVPEYAEEGVDTAALAREALLPKVRPEAVQQASRRRIRAVMWADRFPMSSPEGGRMILAALEGSADALDVLRCWMDSGKDKRATAELTKLIMASPEPTAGAHQDLLARIR